MCDLCRAPERYIPSVGDVLLLDAIETGLLNARGYYVHGRFRTWRHWAKEAEARETETAAELLRCNIDFEGLEEENAKLRARLTKIDEAIAKNMDRCLTLLATHLGKVQCHTTETDELEKILTSLRETYGPKQPTPKR